MPQDQTRQDTVGRLLVGRRTAGLLALALAATTGLGTLPVSGGAPAAPELSRVLVTSAAGDVAAAAAAVNAAGGHVLHRLSLVGGVSAELPGGAVLAPSFRVTPDSPLQVAQSKDGDDGVPVTVRQTIGLPLAPGNEGRGVTVAVVDTGVADVPGLAGRVAHLDATGDGIGDGYGHGTFVAGLVAGSGDSSGSYAGIAPGARILDIRVADKQGRTNLLTVLTGLEMVDATKVRVLNLSLSADNILPYQIDPLSQALETLWRRGVTVVVPSGNDGPAAGTVSAPGSDPVLLTVGGLDENGTAATADDAVAAFSGRGPAPQGVAKPDLVAPASHLVSLRAPDSTVDRANPLSRVGEDYFRGSGTSFSTAITSGAAAALLASRPKLTPGQVKALLTGTAYTAAALGDRNAAGAGGLDLARAAAARTPSAPSEPVATVPGDPKAWEAFVDALLRGDRKSAASSWSQLSPEARNWAASSWSSLSPEARNWAASSWSASSWSGRNWAGIDGTADEWAARNWAARNWAARNWAASSWSGRNWSDDAWANGDWAGRNWSARNWSGGWD